MTALEKFKAVAMNRYSFAILGLMATAAVMPPPPPSAPTTQSAVATVTAAENDVSRSVAYLRSLVDKDFEGGIDTVKTSSIKGDLEDRRAELGDKQDKLFAIASMPRDGNSPSEMTPEIAERMMDAIRALRAGEEPSVTHYGYAKTGL